MLTRDRDRYDAETHLRNTQATSVRPATLPLPYLIPLSAAAQFYCAVTPVDARGRLADRSPLRILKWSPGQPISIIISPAHVPRLSAFGHTAPHAVTRQGHVRLPAAIRHQYGIN